MGAMHGQNPEAFSQRQYQKQVSFLVSHLKMGAKSTKEEKDGVKVVAGDSVSETTTGGFHLLEVLQLSSSIVETVLSSSINWTYVYKLAYNTLIYL